MTYKQHMRSFHLQAFNTEVNYSKHLVMSIKRTHMLSQAKVEQSSPNVTTEMINQKEKEKKKGWKLRFTESLSFLFLKYILNIKLKLWSSRNSTCYVVIKNVVIWDELIHKPEVDCISAPQKVIAQHMLSSLKFSMPLLPSLKFIRPWSVPYGWENHTNATTKSHYETYAIKNKELLWWQREPSKLVICLKSVSAGISTIKLTHICHVCLFKWINCLQI